MTMTREALFHLGVRMLAVGLLVLGLIGTVAAAVAWLETAVDDQAARRSEAHLSVQEAVAKQREILVIGLLQVILGGLLLWRSASVVRWCGAEVDMADLGAEPAAYAEVMVKLVALVIVAQAVLMLPEAFRQWHEISLASPAADAGFILQRYIATYPELAVRVGLGAALLTGARSLIRHVICRPAQA